jgi:hypothetical protein
LRERPLVFSALTFAGKLLPPLGFVLRLTAVDFVTTFEEKPGFPEAEDAFFAGVTFFTVAVAFERPALGPAICTALPLAFRGIAVPS